jgi:hypothetical protein
VAEDERKKEELINAKEQQIQVQKDVIQQMVTKAFIAFSCVATNCTEINDVVQ